MKNIRNAWEGLTLFPKFDLKMKFSLLFFMVTLFQIRADTGYAQKTKISLDMQAVSVLDVIAEIEEVTEFKFLYSKKELDLDRKVSIKAKKKKIQSILEALFKDSSITYDIHDKRITLTKKEISPETKVSPKHKDTVIPKTPKSLQLRVTGRITGGADNAPLPGVNIIVKGTDKGTMSDFNGEYYEHPPWFKVDLPSGKTLMFPGGIQVKEGNHGFLTEIRKAAKEAGKRGNPVAYLKQNSLFWARKP